MRNHIINFKTYSLFLDDIRVPTDCTNYMREARYGTREWVTVRSHSAFVIEVAERFANGQFPELVSFDHDLADEHYDPTMYHGIDNYNVKAIQFKEDTGNESARWFVQFCIDNGIELPECIVHSMNPAGRERINQTLKDYDRYIKNLQKGR